MNKLNSFQKTLPYSDRVFNNIEWCHWFVLFNVMVSVLISIRYILNSNYHSTELGLFYQIINLFGHTWFVNFIFFLIIPFPLAFVIPKERPYKLITIAITTLGQTALLIDSQIFHYFKFHINPTLLQIFSENSNYHSGINFNFLYIVLPILIIIEIMTARYANYKAIKHRTNWITKVFMTIMVSSFVLTHILHIWADYEQYKPILVHDSNLPFSYPMTAKSFIAKNNWLILPKSKQTESTIDDMKYPLSKIDVNTQKVKHLNYLIISLKGWNFDTLNEENMPNTYKLAKTSYNYKNHFATSTEPKNSMFSFFYGISPQYAQTAERHNVESVLINELQGEEYRIKTFVSNNNQNETILDSIIFHNVRNHSTNVLPNDRAVTKQVFSYIEKIKTQNQTEFNDLNHLIYVSFSDTEKLINDSGTEKFHPSVRTDKKSNKTVNNSNAELWRNAYYNSVYSADQKIGAILEKLSETGLRENTVVIITGEYGFDLGFSNPRDFGNTQKYTFANLHVPMIISVYEEEPATYDAISSHTDIVPTILENFLGVQTSANNYSTGDNLLKVARSDDSFVIGGNNNFVYIIEQSQITEISHKGNLIVTDSIEGQQEISIKMPTLLKAMRLLNKFYDSKF